VIKAAFFARNTTINMNSATHFSSAFYYAWKRYAWKRNFDKTSSALSNQLSSICAPIARASFRENVIRLTSNHHQRNEDK
jgi:hypothetical protein